MYGHTDSLTAASDQSTKTCASCGADVLAEAWSCHGCGRPFFAVGLIDHGPTLHERRFYVSAASTRRARSIGRISELVDAARGA